MTLEQLRIFLAVIEHLHFTSLMIGNYWLLEQIGEFKCQYLGVTVNCALHNVLVQLKIESRKCIMEATMEAIENQGVCKNNTNKTLEVYANASTD